MSYLNELNNEQRLAVETTEGPLMIIAGAGSGKTKVLTTRTAHLMQNGVDAFTIMALTFTNKAAAEMKERITKILGTSEAKNLYMGTFHSVFAKILRVEADKLNYPNNFTIYDTEDSRSVLKAIIKELALDEKLYKPNFVHNRISTAKNNLIGPIEYAEDATIQSEDARSNRQDLKLVYRQYVDKCFKNGAMDFDDILMNMYILLRKFPDVLAKYQYRFKYMMIDEYQDTNLAQYHIIKLLSAVTENICVVGDDAQSIYSFRGASMQNIFQFQKDYPDLKTIKLEQNYRSTKIILEAANNVIKKNGNQIPKELWTDNDTGQKIKVTQSASDADEGRIVADIIIENKLRYHARNQDFAILYRTNAQSRSFEESLRRLNIPYKIYGGMSFYQRKEVKDMIALLRVVVNPQDEEAVRRCITIAVKGVGNTSLQKISIYSAEQNISFWAAMEKAEEVGVRGAAQASLQNFILMIKSFQVQLDKKNAFDIAMGLAKQSGFLQELNNDKSVEGLARFENLESLLNSIKEFTETPDEDGTLDDKALGNYLQQITLLTGDEADAKDNPDVVKLMTIHAAKGLEFPQVFIVGMEENVFPSAMSMYDREDLEEERRLFYVAITRAKEKLVITTARNRYRFGSLISNDPSRFLQELPNHLCDISMQQIAKPSGPPSLWGQRANSNSTTERSIPQKRVMVDNSVSKHTPSDNFIASNPTLINEGMKVEHQKFGFGVVSVIEGGIDNKKAKIIFENGIGEKMMMLNFAKLKIVE
jgi:DNA helicase II / ATP-dependent DNA helicase PcrA